MIEELNYMDYYSSGFILDRLSYSLKISTKNINKYDNKEEVKTAKLAQVYFFFFLIKEVVVNANIINKNDQKIWLY